MFVILTSVRINLNLLILYSGALLYSHVYTVDQCLKTPQSNWPQSGPNLQTTTTQKNKNPQSGATHSEIDTKTARKLENAFRNKSYNDLQNMKVSTILFYPWFWVPPNSGFSFSCVRLATRCLLPRPLVVPVPPIVGLVGSTDGQIFGTSLRGRRGRSCHHHYVTISDHSTTSREYENVVSTVFMNGEVIA